MPGYYTHKLAAERLRACYELAPPRVKSYLQAEIEFVLHKLASWMVVLELGCGYGRVLREIVARVRAASGIDTSLPSLRLARDVLGRNQSVHLAAMDAACMGFSRAVFDMTICIQNGISAFAVDQQQLFSEAIRVTRSGGSVLFSSYSDRFWPDRLQWFEIQAAHGLVGAIDYTATGNGTIVCKDGFRATTVSATGFKRLAEGFGLAPSMLEVDESSLFCEVVVP